jgi:hypothetical protein
LTKADKTNNETRKQKKKQSGRVIHFIVMTWKNKTLWKCNKYGLACNLSKIHFPRG